MLKARGPGFAASNSSSSSASYGLSIVKKAFYLSACKSGLTWKEQKGNLGKLFLFLSLWKLQLLKMPLSSCRFLSEGGSAQTVQWCPHPSIRRSLWPGAGRCSGPWVSEPLQAGAVAFLAAVSSSEWLFLKRPVCLPWPRLTWNASDHCCSAGEAPSPTRGACSEWLQSVCLVVQVSL